MTAVTIFVKIELNSITGVIMEQIIRFELTKEQAQSLLEFVQATRNKGIDLETYLQNVFDKIYQDVTAIQDMAQEVNELLYTGLSNTCL